MITPKRIALKEIAEYVANKDNDREFNVYEVWDVCANHLNSKSITDLNKDLGIFSINKGKHNMTRKRTNNHKLTKR